MLPYFIPLLLIILSSCKNTPNDNSNSPAISQMPSSDPTYVWTKLADSAVWRKNYNYQLFSIHDTIWTFHPDGNWFSADGKQWTKSTLPNAINNLAFLDYVYYKNAVFGLGYYAGNIEQFTYRPEIYKTTNFKKWDLIATQSNLPRRFFYHPFVFQDKLWIIGGEDQITKYSDIWNSTDGIHWIKQKETQPYAKTSGSQILILKDTLYLLNNDVWISTDALNWQQHSSEIVQGEILFGYSALVFDAKIWLLGCNRNGQFTSEVLYSTVGKKSQSQHAPWLARGCIAATVHQNKIYITGGKYGGTPTHPNFRYDNDIWIMQKN